MLKQLNQAQAQTQAQAHAQAPAVSTPSRKVQSQDQGGASSGGRKQRATPPASSSSSPDERNKSESTEIEEVSLSVSEGDDYSDSVSSIGGDHFFDQTISVSLNNSFSDTSEGRKTANSSSSRNKRLLMMAANGGGGGGGSVGGGIAARGVRGSGGSRHLVLNKYKAEIYVLQNQLEDAQALDKTMLQDRIREYQ